MPPTRNMIDPILFATFIRKIIFYHSIIIMNQATKYLEGLHQLANQTVGLLSNK